MAHTTTEVEYGVRYLNGTEDWDTARWFGTIDIPESRETFKEQYDLRMEGMGAPPLPLIFLRRNKTVTYDAAEVIDDTPAPEPEPEVTTPEPEETIDPEPTPEVPEPTPEEVNEDGTEPGTDPEPERQ